ncbi:unnamed protein product [Eretmochelys imbricata]
MVLLPLTVFKPGVKVNGVLEHRWNLNCKDLNIPHSISPLSPHSRLLPLLTEFVNACECLLNKICLVKFTIHLQRAIDMDPCMDPSLLNPRQKLCRSCVNAGVRGNTAGWRAQLDPS